MRFTTNGRCAKNNTHIYVARTSNNRVIMACDLYCCLLPRCEALRTCRSGFPIATGIGRIFSREGPFVDFPWGGKSGEISFYPLGKVENNLFCQNFDRKISNFKTQGGALPPLHPLPRPTTTSLVALPDQRQSFQSGLSTKWWRKHFIHQSLLHWGSNSTKY